MNKRWTAVLSCTALLLFSVINVTAAPTTAPSVSSLSAVVYEPQSGTVLYDKDGRTARPMASTTKLMTALLSAEALAADRTVTVPAAALPVEGSQIGLTAGDTATVRDLLAGLLLSSGNDAANALALLTADSFDRFAVLMNERALELGMTDSHFVTPSGLDVDGHAASARDMALLGAAVLQKPLLAELCAAKTASVTIGGRHMTITNHNKLLKLYDGCIGMKTGFTKKSGRCLVSAATRNGVTLVIATLNGGDYWNDHMALYNYAFSLVHTQTPEPDAPTDCPVVGGTVSAVPLDADMPEPFVLLDGEVMTKTVELPRFVWAPVTAGQRIGCVRYTAGDRELGVREIRAAADVPEQAPPSGWEYFMRHMRQLLFALCR